MTRKGPERVELVVRVLPDREAPAPDGGAQGAARGGEEDGLEELARLCAMLLDQDGSS